MTNQSPKANAGQSLVETPDRSNNRPGLIIPWREMPWWAVIIIIVGILVGYSMLSNIKYIEALTFILDLPWHKESLQEELITVNEEWVLTSKVNLDPGKKYTLYVEYLDEDNEVMGRTDSFFIQIAEDAVDQEIEPLITPSQEYIILDTTRPSVVGTSSIGVKAILFDDFSRKPLRILVNLWESEGLFLTLRVTIISFSCALILGLMFGLMRVADKSPDLRENIFLRMGVGLIIIILFAVLKILPTDTWKIAVTFIGIEAFMILLPAIPYTVSTLYVEVIRGLPMLVIVLYMGFAITPAIRDASGNWFTGEIDLRGIASAVIGLSIGYGAYITEVFRGGIESIPKGQMEAARSVGMSYFQAMRYVILPQAIRVILPPLGNDFIAMLKDSSLISVIALPELLQRGRLWISRTFRAFEGYNSVALMYLIMTLMLSLLVRVIERRSSID
jgi:polar amino acid transport system permease protein